MDKHAISRTRRRGLAATGAVALGLVVVVPAQAALASDTPSASVANNTLTITGTGGGDTMQLGLGADPNTLLVDLGNGTLPQAFDRSTFNAISVFLNRGDDTFNGGFTGGPISDE